MNLLDAQYTKTPFYGVRNMTTYLRNLGHAVGKGHVRTLLRKMGLTAVFPKPNQVWSADITYIRLTQGWAYLIAIIDWFSRYVINWQLSNTLEIDFCLNCLNQALDHNKQKPSIFNSDQGSQFTSTKFTNILDQNKINISMDGRGRCLDNIFVERLWRSVKQENIYLNDYQNILETKTGLNQYFTFYNNQRRHQSLNYETPAKIYYQ